MRTSSTRSMNEGVGVGGGPVAGGNGAAGTGVTGGGGARGVSLLPPMISPFRTDGMSVRNSILRTAERAMPPKTATIGFQMPSPWNRIPVMPLGDSKSSDSIAILGRRPLPRTTSLPSSTAKCSFVTAPSSASASIDVLGEPCTSSAYFGMAGTLPARRSASTFKCPSLTIAPSRSSGLLGEAGALSGASWPSSVAPTRKTVPARTRERMAPILTSRRLGWRSASMIADLPGPT